MKLSEELREYAAQYKGGKELEMRAAAALDAAEKALLRAVPVMEWANLEQSPPGTYNYDVGAAKRALALLRGGGDEAR